MNPQRKILSVSQLNRESRFLLEKNLSTLWVDGEISNLSRPASGHIYFTLKDAQAQIRCAMFRNRLNHIRFRPENGAQVQIRGSVSLYEARGDYQLIAEHMEAGGDGALQRAFEQLKRELEREGLFNPAHKQPIPALPTRVGVITSPSGAAIHDILSVLQRRFPSLPIIIYPTAVQGEQATQEVVSAIQQAEQQQQCDLLVITRGGGSIEDLWTFNQEAVARAIYHCPLPIISAVGHETDFTIADFVADQRAPTPSAAAESISPDREQWLEGVKQLAQRLIRSNQHILQIHTQQLQGLKKRLRHPGERIQQFTQRLDESEQRLQRAQQQTLGRKSEQLQRIRLSLQHNAPEHKISVLQQRLESHYQQLHHTMQHQLQHRADQLAGLAQTLDALSPLSTLSRGYSITLNNRQQAVQDAAQLSVGEEIETRLEKGSVVSQVLTTHPHSPP